MPEKANTPSSPSAGDSAPTEAPHSAMPSAGHPLDKPPRPSWRSMSTDFILWFGLLGLAAWGAYYGLVGQYQGRHQEIHLHFRDANEITRGSAVKMMGTDIGYVDGIALHKDFVDVTVKTYPDSIIIPSGSTFTVLFTGIVGSKSIEIIPPPATRPFSGGKPQYLVENPIRLRQALQYQIDIAEALKHGAENFTNMFGNEKPTEILQYNILRARDAVVMGNEYLKDMNVSVVEKSNTTHEFFATANKTLNDFNNATEEAKAPSDPKYLEPALYASLRYLGLLLKESQATMMTFQSAQGFRHINQEILDIQAQVERVVHLPLDKIEGELIRLQMRVNRFEQSVQAFALSLDGSGKSQLTLLHKKIRNVNAQIQNWRPRR